RQTKPADFMRAKFAYQLSHREQGTIAMIGQLVLYTVYLVVLTTIVPYPDIALRRQVEALQESALGRATSMDHTTLAVSLRRARRQHIHRKTTADAAWLPTLNLHWVGVLLIVALLAGYESRPIDAATAVVPPTYVGGQACIACHPHQ